MTTNVIDNIEFEVRLYETLGKIEFVYGFGVNINIFNYTIGIQDTDYAFVNQYAYPANLLPNDVVTYIFDDCNNT